MRPVLLRAGRFAALRAAGFLAAVFLAAVFLAAVFLAAVFLTALLRAAALPDATLRTGAFRPVVGARLTFPEPARAALLEEAVFRAEGFFAADRLDALLAPTDQLPGPSVAG